MHASRRGSISNAGGADTLHESKTIHEDIWQHIAAADFLVVDVTGLNANVMIEYGVAAAIRRPYQVILIRSEEDKSRLPFDAFAHRYLTYRRSITGDKDFIQGLVESILHAITPAPYVLPSVAKAGGKGFSIDLRKGDRPDLILSPGVTHRRLEEDGLEFGSLYIFRNSWFLLTQFDRYHVRVRLRFRFEDIRGNPEDSYVGAALRSQHYLANWVGHMVWVQADGRVMRTEPRDDVVKYENVEVDRLPAFDYRDLTFVDLSVEIDEGRLAFAAESSGGCVECTVAVRDMPYVYGPGKVRVLVLNCRVRIQTIELTPISPRRRPKSRVDP